MNLILKAKNETWREFLLLLVDTREEKKISDKENSSSDTGLFVL